MAVDLREVVGALRLANDLERIGDLAKNIAKRVMALNGEFPPPKLIRGVEHMTDLVLQQMKLVKPLPLWARLSSWMRNFSTCDQDFETASSFVTIPL